MGCEGGKQCDACERMVQTPRGLFCPELFGGDRRDVASDSARDVVDSDVDDMLFVQGRGWYERNMMSN